MDKQLKEKMIKKAKEAWNNAYAPYSSFPVGVALLTTEGKIFTGCNIENAAFGLTNCAERTAIFKAVSEGYRDFQALLLITDTDDPVFPCGSCRQVIREFEGKMEIILINFKGDEIEVNSDQLLPGAFGKGDLEDGI